MCIYRCPQGCVNNGSLLTKAELNAPQDIITCGPAGNIPPTPYYDCIPMTSKDVGLVNAIFAVGGFISASVAGSIADKWGRRRLSFVNCFVFVLGSLIIASSRSVLLMCVGRLIAGLAAGSAIVVTPLYLNEISPPQSRGLLGSMNQISVNVGILAAQVLGLYYSNRTDWRRILYSAAVIGSLNAVLLTLCVESPKWLALRGMTAEASASLVHLRGKTDVDDELCQWKSPHDVVEDVERSGLLSAERDVEANSNRAPRSTGKITAAEFCTSTRYRPILAAVIGVMVAQQIVGINSIIFYGVSILRSTIPKYSGLVNVMISVLNLCVTGLISPLVDKFGRRPLLLTSILGMTLSASILAKAMTDDMAMVASFAATLFVVSFAVGLGPIPFLIISELTPGSAVGVAQSIGTTANWMANFSVGFLFPILKTELGSHVFYIFTLTGAAAFVFVYKRIPETRGKSPAEIWDL
jgi:SP family facilitated glucose transporter-like MFS transporter 1